MFACTKTNNLIKVHLLSICFLFYYYLALLCTKLEEASLQGQEYDIFCTIKTVYVCLHD